MLKIYGVPISVHTRKVIVAAIEKRLVYQNDPVIPFTPPPGWDRLSPTGKIPVMIDGDASLADSSVICTYLDRTYPERPIYPPDTKDYIQALWFEEYADGTMFREVVHPLFFQTYIRPNILKQEPDRSIVDATRREALPKVFGYLETVTGKHYLAGSQLSLADIAVTSNLLNYQYLGFELDSERYPRLSAFFCRCVQHPSICAALKAEQQVAEAMGLKRSFLEPLMA